MSLKPTKEGIHPSGKVIEFYEDEHVYSIKGEPEISFTSATTWIGQFFEEFDREKVSANYALKHNMHQADVLAMWDETARIARDRGTLVHAKAEEAINHFQNNGQNLELNDVLTPEDGDGVSNDPELTRHLISSMHDAVVKMSGVLDFVQSECVIASPELRLSGMIDLVVKLRSKKDYPVVGLYDWKTNKKIEEYSQWRNGLTPINHLSDCNFMHYSLQLNLYEYICRREGYHSPDTEYQKVLIHLTPNGYKTYKCADLQAEIKSMLECDPERLSTKSL